MILSLVLAQVAEQAPAVAKASPAIVNNFQIALLAFKSGGWIVALIGAAAMVGRLLVDEAADASWQRSLRHVIAAAIFAVIAYFVTFQWELSALNKAIVQGLCGAVAPELVDWLSTTIRKKLGFKDKQKTPAWKSLFSRKKKPKRRRRTTAKKAAPAKAAPKKGAKKPAAKKPAAKKPAAKKPAAKKAPAEKKPPAKKPNL
ncbi:MAG: Histone H1-like nucleoprotein [Verrucomicrobiota bacterium]